ncbi:MAG: hypothetical protein ABIE94_05905, partial [archaeon]
FDGLRLQELDHTSIADLINKSPSFKLLYRIREQPPKRVKKQKNRWEALDPRPYQVVRYDVYVRSVGFKDDYVAVGALVELLGDPSSFSWTCFSDSRLRYDRLDDGPKPVLEEIFVYLDKIAHICPRDD